ncbi:phospholipase effector Tle1 domain-containing protein [Bradyrhizobium yuanmingense]
MGAGIKRNIADCYEFIVNHYRPGDRIFLFGFSRGA